MWNRLKVLFTFASLRGGCVLYHEALVSMGVTIMFTDPQAWR